jgi:hypothetical protein
MSLLYDSKEWTKRNSRFYSTVPHSLLAIHDGEFEKYPADSRICDLSALPLHTLQPSLCSTPPTANVGVASRQKWHRTRNSLKDSRELGDDDKTDRLNSTSTTLQQNLSKMVAVFRLKWLPSPQNTEQQAHFPSRARSVPTQRSDWKWSKPLALSVAAANPHGSRSSLPTTSLPAPAQNRWITSLPSAQLRIIRFQASSSWRTTHHLQAGYSPTTARQR